MHRTKFESTQSENIAPTNIGEYKANNYVNIHIMVFTKYKRNQRYKHQTVAKNMSVENKNIPLGT